MAWRQNLGGSEQHLTRAAAAARTRTQRPGKHLAVRASELVVKPDFQILRRYRRPLLLRLEDTHRPPREDYVHRATRLGSSRSLNMRIGIRGLGHSAMAQRYAIRDLDQAMRYLADPILGSRLRHDVRLMIGHKGKSALEILGSPDDLKFRSCLTLFGQVASDSSDRMLLIEALDQFYDGEPDPRTLELLSMLPSQKYSP